MQGPDSPRRASESPPAGSAPPGGGRRLGARARSSPGGIPRPRTALAAVAVVAAISLAAVFAPPRTVLAQQAPAPAPAPARPGTAETGAAAEHKIRGVLAWRKAVWSSDGASYARSAKELESALAAGIGDDFTTLFLLGHAYTRLGDATKAEGPLTRARAISPDFPGHLLAHALLISCDTPAVKRGARSAEAIAVLDEYLVRIARYDRGAAFAAELEYLGWLERGLRQFATEAVDRGISDLKRAAGLARAERRERATELTRTLAECHKRVGEQSLAYDLLLEELKRDPAEASHYHVLGLVSADRKESAAARVWYERAVTRRPEFAEPRPKLAYLAHEAFDLFEMRCQLEIYSSLLTARWIAAPQTRSSTVAANLNAGWGTYWRARGDRLAEAGDKDGSRRCWVRARDAFLQASAEHPGCIRALAGIVEVLSLLDAPEEEIERRTRELIEIRSRDATEASIYRDSFCAVPVPPCRRPFVAPG